MTTTETPHPYGYCTQCGSPGLTRERRINGNDTCTNGHVYPSSLARISDPTERTTLSGRLPEQMGLSAPAPINPATGQNFDYWVLSEAERAKGFCRPVRRSYLHVGIKICGKVTKDEPGNVRVCRGTIGHEGPCDDQVQTLVTPAERAKVAAENRRRGCDSLTTMSSPLAETYARDPKFYGATFCCACGEHYPVGEFVWDGTTEVVGS